MRYLISTLFLTLLYLSNCSQKNFDKKENFLVSIKSLEFKYSDIGIISKDGKALLIKLFSLGNEILKIEFDTFVKVNNGIGIPYALFNSKYIGADYPAETIREIFGGEKIFNGENLKSFEGGFSQEIGNIQYLVSNKERVFRDRDRGILIKISKIEKGL